mmetsp:Transcript_56944/g.133757  ORF Transcript_56944/g.133757 Transcript_56944/m.133757 type:complete len:109 (+) Transcript_56944:1-327(+)
MGQAPCRRRAQSPGIVPTASARGASLDVIAPGLPANAPAQEPHRRRTEDECQKCVLAYSRVGPQVIRGAKTVGELREYLADLQARERMLNGYEGDDVREENGLTGQVR